MNEEIIKYEKLLDKYYELLAQTSAYEKALEWVIKGLFEDKRNIIGKLFYKKYALFSPKQLKELALNEAIKEIIRGK